MSLSQELVKHIGATLLDANTAFNKLYPGESDARQPVQTVYGGAQLFKADSARKLGAVALRLLQEYAPTAAAFSKALRLKGTPAQQKILYNRIVEKLNREPVEDFPIHFEDGYGNRPDTEEDGHAESAAGEVALGQVNGTLPPFIGIRIKPFNEELRARSFRTLDIFVSTLAEKTEGRLPNNFVITLPKITIAEQVAALANLLGRLEGQNGVAEGSLKFEMIIETTQSIINHRGEINLPLLLSAA